MLQTPQYAATVTLYVSTQASAENTSAAYQGSLLSEQRVQSYRELLTGDRVVSSALARLGYEMDLAEFRQNLNVSSEPNTVLLAATYTAHDPYMAAESANAVGEEFRLLVAELEQPADPLQPPIVDVRTVQPAQIPDEPSGPSLAISLALGLTGGSTIAIIFALFRQHFDDRLRDDSDAEGALSIPVLGRLPEAKNELIGQVFSTSGDSMLAEAVRGLRANYQFVDLDGDRRVIVITSSSPSEGKTTVACELAQSLAAAGSRVLIIDADLRKPSVHRIFGIDGTVGLTTVLTGRVTLDQAAVPWGGMKLFLLPSAVRPPNPNELLGSAQMSQLLLEARRRFDYVIVDTPPLLAVSDAVVLSTRADGVVLIARMGQTRARNLHVAKSMLGTVGAKLAGLVLNCYEADRGSGAYMDYGATPAREGGGTQVGGRGSAKLFSTATAVDQSGGRSPRRR